MAFGAGLVADKVDSRGHASRIPALSKRVLDRYACRPCRAACATKRKHKEARSKEEEGGDQAAQSSLCGCVMFDLHCY